MLEADPVIFYLMAICWVEVNTSDVFYSANICCFIHLFSMYLFCMLIERLYFNKLNDFTEVYSFLWIAVYIKTVA